MAAGQADDLFTASYTSPLRLNPTNYESPLQFPQTGQSPTQELPTLARFGGPVGGAAVCLHRPPGSRPPAAEGYPHLRGPRHDAHGAEAAP